MNPNLQPFITVALPIMVTIVAAMWSNNSRLTDMRESMNRGFADVNRRIDELIKRLDRIEVKLDNHEQRITRIEERTSPLATR